LFKYPLPTTEWVDVDTVVDTLQQWYEHQRLFYATVTVLSMAASGLIFAFILQWLTSLAGIDTSSRGQKDKKATD